jgi:uncharacterized protein
VIYEWDSEKASINLKKHGISFDVASSVFLDPLALTFSDPDHSIDEKREITIGHTSTDELIFVCHCQRAARIRIISARKVTKRERDQYEKGFGEKS